MRRHDRSTLDSLQRVREFLTQHPLADAPDRLGAQAAELDDAIQCASNEAVGQDSAIRFTRVHLEQERQLAQLLYADHILPIARVAKGVFSASGLDAAFRAPRIKVAVPLIAAARAMADAAEKEKDVFLRHALAPDFVEQLRAATSALEDKRRAKTESTRLRITATASVQEQLKRGRKAVRMLDAVLVPRLRKDPQLLAAWKSARKVRPTAAPVAAEPNDAALKVA